MKPIDKLTSSLFHLPWIKRFDVHMRVVMRGSVTAMAMRFSGVAVGMTFSLALARTLGAEGAGIYFIGLNIVILSSIIGRLGTSRIMLRLIARYNSSGDWATMAGIYQVGMGMVFTVSFLMMLAIFAGAGVIANRVFTTPSLEVPLRIMALGILPHALLSTYGELLRGLERIANYVFIQTLGLNLFNLPLLIVLVPIFDVPGVAISFLLSCLLLLLAGFIMWRRATPELRHTEAVPYERRDLLQASLPLMWTMLTNQALGQADTMLLGIWLGAADVGVYGIAKRFAIVTSTVLSSVTDAVGPRFAVLFSQQEMQKLGQLVRSSVRLTLLIATPVLAIYILFPDQVLSLFGPHFTTGRDVLVLIALGQFINVLTGSVGSLLIMTEHERIVRDNTFLFAVLNVVLLVLLVPWQGIVGAALAFALTITVSNLLLVFIAYHKLGVMTLPLPQALIRKW